MDVQGQYEVNDFLHWRDHAVVQEQLRCFGNFPENPVSSDCPEGRKYIQENAPGRNRTCGTQIRNLLLYPLSYRGLKNLFYIKLLSRTDFACLSQVVDFQNPLHGHIVLLGDIA